MTLEPATGTAAGAGGTTRTTGDGGFRIDLARGSYTMMVSAPIKTPGVRPPDPTHKVVTVADVSVTDLRIVVRTEAR